MPIKGLLGLLAYFTLINGAVSKSTPPSLRATSPRI